MVVVIGVVGGPQRGGEDIATAGVNRAQEGPIAPIAPPAVLDGDEPTIAQAEARDIDGVGMSVLRQRGTAHIVHGPTRIRGCDLDLHDRPAVVASRRGLDHILHEAFDGGDHVAAKRGRRIEGHRATGSRRHHKWFDRPTRACTTERATADQPGALINAAGTEAGLFLGGTPRFGGCIEIGQLRHATAELQHTDHQREDDTDATNTHRIEGNRSKVNGALRLPPDEIVKDYAGVMGRQEEGEAAIAGQGADSTLAGKVEPAV